MIGPVIGPAIGAGADGSAGRKKRAGVAAGSGIKLKQIGSKLPDRHRVARRARAAFNPQRRPDEQEFIRAV
ncbi:MAG: hypothetical protein O7A67_01950, partial [SAR324 cluster bacterium]|nr:hypothetical protein [SAR324 cluster bacterium]